jgi:nitrogen fixation-related uncharacterized protein
VAVVLVAVILVLGLVWSMQGKQSQKGAEDRRATILRGAGGAPPLAGH